jgi:hypothetical protein
MEKHQVKIADLPDHVVLALRSNDYVRLYHRGVPVEYISVTPGANRCKYRVTTSQGQVRSDDPVIEITR